MTAPDAIQSRHQPVTLRASLKTACNEDGQPWPCDARLEGDRADRAEAALRLVVSDPIWVNWGPGSNAALDAARAALAASPDTGPETEEGRA